MKSISCLKIKPLISLSFKPFSFNTISELSLIGSISVSNNLTNKVYLEEFEKSKKLKESNTRLQSSKSSQSNKGLKSVYCDKLNEIYFIPQIDLPCSDLIQENIEETPITEVELKGRNSRIPNQANHGARPCSSYTRRLRLKKLNRGKMRTKDEE